MSSLPTTWDLSLPAARTRSTTPGLECHVPACNLVLICDTRGIWEQGGVHFRAACLPHLSHQWGREGGGGGGPATSLRFVQEPNLP